MQALLEKCIMQEEKYQFDSFTQTDAKKLGDLIYEESLKYNRPVAIEIRINHLLVYRFYPTGTNANNELWLRAKANTVDMWGMSSLRFYAQLEVNGETLDDWRMDEKDFAKCGGGFPLTIRNSGVIGSIGASGLPHEKDHQVIIDALERYFAEVR